MDRLWLVGWVLIFLGIILFILAPLALLMFTPSSHVVAGGIVWIFPFPPIAWGRGIHIPGILYWLMVIAYVIFIVLCIIAIVSYIKSRGREDYE